MKKSEMKYLDNHVVELDHHINSKMAEILNKHGDEVAMNVMMNLGTSLLAKAILLTPDDLQEKLEEVFAMMTDAKVKEGKAAIASLMVIGNAMVH